MLIFLVWSESNLQSVFFLLLFLVILKNRMLAMVGVLVFEVPFNSFSFFPITPAGYEYHVS